MNLPTPSRVKLALFREPFRRICLSADLILATSHHSLGTMLAGEDPLASRHRVHYCSVDPMPFQGKTDRDSIRAALNLPREAKILLFAGRIAPEKNPVMVVDVLTALRKCDPSIFAVFAGSGGLEEAVKQHANSLGVAKAVRLIGWRNDLHEVMKAADWFILPHPESPMEGFGIAVVEAQLAGLRLLLSRGIADDPLLPTAKFRRLSLSDQPQIWARAAMDMMAEPAPSAADALAALKSSPMDMDFALKDLLRIYDCSTVFDEASTRAVACIE